MIVQVLGDQAGVDVVAAACRGADDQPQIPIAIEISNRIGVRHLPGEAGQHQGEQAQPCKNTLPHARPNWYLRVDTLTRF